MNLYNNVRNNILKTYLLLSIFIVVFGVFGYCIYYYTKNEAYIYLALIYAIFSSIVSY